MPAENYSTADSRPCRYRNGEGSTRRYQHHALGGTASPRLLGETSQSLSMVNSSPSRRVRGTQTWVITRLVSRHVPCAEDMACRSVALTSIPYPARRAALQGAWLQQQQAGQPGEGRRGPYAVGKREVHRKASRYRLRPLRGAAPCPMLSSQRLGIASSGSILPLLLSHQRARHR